MAKEMEDRNYPTSYWQVVVSIFDMETTPYLCSGATGSKDFLLACTGLQIKKLTCLHIQTSRRGNLWEGFSHTSNTIADTMDVVMRLQKTRKSEYLKNSSSTPYGTLMIFSYTESTRKQTHLVSQDCGTRCVEKEPECLKLLDTKEQYTNSVPK